MSQFFMWFIDLDAYLSTFLASLSFRYCYPSLAYKGDGGHTHLFWTPWFTISTKGRIYKTLGNALASLAKSIKLSRVHRECAPAIKMIKRNRRVCSSYFGDAEYLICNLYYPEEVVVSLSLIDVSARDGEFWSRLPEDVRKALAYDEYVFFICDSLQDAMNIAHAACDSGMAASKVFKEGIQIFNSFEEEKLL